MNFFGMHYYFSIFRRSHNILTKNGLLTDKSGNEFFKKDFTLDELNEFHIFFKKIRHFENIYLISVYCFFFLCWLLFHIFELYSLIYHIHILYLCLLLALFIFNLKMHKEYIIETKKLARNSNTPFKLFMIEMFSFPAFLSCLYFSFLLTFETKISVSAFNIPMLTFIISVILPLIILFISKNKKERIIISLDINKYIYKILKNSDIVHDGIFKTLVYSHDDIDTTLPQNNIYEIKEIATAHHHFSKATYFWHIGFTLFSLLSLNFILTSNYPFSIKYPLDKLYMVYTYFVFGITIYSVILSFCNWRLPFIIFKLSNMLKIDRKVSITFTSILSLPLVITSIFSICSLFMLILSDKLFVSFFIINVIFIPILYIFLSIYFSSLSHRASDILESHGLEVGFFGVSPNELRKLSSQQENNIDTSILNIGPANSEQSDETALTQYDE